MTQKPHALNEADELFPEPAVSVSEFRLPMSDVPAMPLSAVRKNSSPAPEDDEVKSNGTLQLIEKQEVGIT